VKDVAGTQGTHDRYREAWYRLRRTTRNVIGCNPCSMRSVGGHNNSRTPRECAHENVWRVTGIVTDEPRERRSEYVDVREIQASNWVATVDRQLALAPPIAVLTKRLVAQLVDVYPGGARQIIELWHMRTLGSNDAPPCGLALNQDNAARRAPARVPYYKAEVDSSLFQASECHISKHIVSDDSRESDRDAQARQRQCRSRRWTSARNDDVTVFDALVVSWKFIDESDHVCGHRANAQNLCSAALNHPFLPMVAFAQVVLQYAHVVFRATPW
jgi:hypothetical protein